MEHVLNLLRSFHNTLVENGQDGSQLDEVIKIFDPANQRYDPARRGSLWRVDVEEKLTQQEEKGKLDASTLEPTSHTPPPPPPNHAPLPSPLCTTA